MGTEGLLEGETSQKLEITEKAGLAERKANALQGELEISCSFGFCRSQQEANRYGAR